MKEVKSIFITGISSGIGLDATRYLIYQGYHVIGSVRKESDREHLLNTFHEKLDVVVFDTTDKKSICQAARSIKSILPEGYLAALINNAGIAVPGPLYYLEDEEFERQLKVNVIGVRNVTNALLPYLGFGKDSNYPRGKIINISSVSGLFNVPFNGAYCISKHALESMTDIYRRELYKEGIDVIAIEPGPIKTNIWQKNIGQLARFEDTHYGDIMKKADTMIANAEQSALPVEVVSKLIHRIIESPKPHSRYLIHPKKRIFKLLAKYIPDRWVDKLVWKNFEKSRSYRPV